MFHQDLPIEKSKQDIFNRNNYAKNLAEALLKSQYKSSFVVGLYGEWGSGKTSLCNMILEKIRGETEKHDEDNSHIVAQTINSEKSIKDEQVVIFQFNPWLCSDATQLINQFFIQLGATLQIKNKNLASIAKSIFNYAEIISNLSSPFIPISGYISKICSWAKEKCSKNEKQKKTIQNIKNDIIKELKQQNIKLFITIDDIDRLSEQEIVAVFQLVKALGDFPNTIYFLCFDYDIVTTALNNIHKNKGKDYLEKIVQLPVSMPKINSKDLRMLFNSNLEKTIDEQDKIELNSEQIQKIIILYENGIKFYLHSLRDINRFTNTFSLIYKQIGEETDFIDLVGIVCLQLFEPTLHSLLPYLKHKFFASFYEEQKMQKKECQKIFNNLLENQNVTIQKEPAKFIVEFLFTGIITDYEYNRNEAIKNKKISCEESFDRYFSYAIHDTELSKVALKHTLYEADETKQLSWLKYQFQKNKFLDIMNEIFSYYHESNNDYPSSQQTQSLFKNLTFLWEDFAKDEPGLFSISESWRYRMLVKLLVKFIHKDELATFLENLFKTDSHLSMLARIIRIFSEKEIEFKLSSQLFIKLKDIFMKRGEELLESAEIKYDNTKLDFIWLLNEYKPEQTKNKVTELLLSSSFFARYINRCTIHGQEFSDNFSQITWSLSIYSLQTFLTNQEALEKATNFIQNQEFLNFDEKTQLNITALYLNLSANINRTKDDYFSLDYTQLKTKLEEIKDNLK